MATAVAPTQPTIRFHAGCTLVVHSLSNSCVIFFTNHKMRKFKLTKPLLLALGLGCSLSVSARERLDAAAKAGGANSGGSGNRITANCLTSSSFSSLDINNVRAMVLNGGDMWWDFSSARYEVPKVTDPNLPKRHAIFAGA